MNKLISTFLFTSIILICGIMTSTNHADAHVIDEIRTKSIQNDYETAYPLIVQYTGTKSGVTFESYSTKWSTTDKLKQLEEELLENKHGEELDLLGRVIIIPNTPAGKNVLGQYFAEYRYTPTYVKLNPNRTIYLFDGDNQTTIESMAYTLSHEYGHHFMYYHLLNRENKLPGTWKTSLYTEKRGIQQQYQANVHDTTFGEYKWALPEIMAEDYVQLFGSDTAIKQYAQMNVDITTPFDVPSFQQYWGKYLPSYQPKPTLPLYLTGYETNPFNTNMYNLQLLIRNMDQQPTYIHATEATGKYASVLLDTIKNQDEASKWFNYRELNKDINWVLDRIENSSIRLNAIQHAETGFNRGSKTLRLDYKNLAAIVTNEADIPKVGEIPKEDESTIFPDVPAGETGDAIAFLSMKKIISGYPDGTFKPNQALTRRQAAAMLIRELGLTLPEGYTMKATDMQPSNAGYHEMAIMEAYGLMGKNGQLNPNGYLTRAQMAQIMVEAYKTLYEEPSENISFTDVKPGEWSYDYINTLAANHITITAGGAFKPNGNVTRAQFALFLKRTIDLRGE
jgi:hypothetical protein